MTTSNGNDETLAGGTDATQVGGAPPSATPPRGPEDDGDDNRKWWLIIGGILLVGLLVGAGIAVAGGGGDDETADSTSTSSSSSTSSSTTSTTNAPATTKATAPAPTTTTTTNVNDDPKIDSYTASPASHTCALSTDSWTLTLAWATTNTNQVVLSVDGPGVYQTYNSSSGSQALTPACPPAGTNAQHTYTITAKGPNGPDAVRTITYSVNTVP